MLNDLSKHPVVVVLSASAVIATLIGFGFAWGSQTTSNVVLDPDQPETVVENSDIGESTEDAPSLAAGMEDEAPRDEELVEMTPPGAQETSLRGLEPFGDSSLIEWADGSIGLGPTQEMMFLGASIVATAEYRLDRNFSTFRATVGYSDSASAGVSAEFWMEDEGGNIIFPKTGFGLGESQQIEVDVSTAIRVIFKVGATDSWDEGFIGIANGTFEQK